MQEERFLPVVANPEDNIEFTSEGGRKLAKLSDNTTVPIVDGTIFGCTMIQPGSIRKNKALKGQAGKFVMTAAGSFVEGMEARETLVVLPIGVISRGRQLMPPYDENGENKPLCSSYDGMHPADWVESPFSEQCVEVVDKPNGRTKIENLCPKSIWGHNGERPECQEMLHFLFFDLETNMPFRYTFRGAGMGAYNQFRRRLKMEKDLANLRGENPFARAVRLTSEDKGTYFKIELTYCKPPEGLKPEDYVNLMAYYHDTLLPCVYKEQIDEEEKQQSKAQDAPAGTAPVDSGKVTDYESDDEEEVVV